MLRSPGLCQPWRSDSGESQVEAITRRLTEAEHAIRTRAERTRLQVLADRQPDPGLAQDALHLRRLVRFLGARLDSEEEGPEVARLRSQKRALEADLGNLDRYARGERPSAPAELRVPGEQPPRGARGGWGGLAGRVTASPSTAGLGGVYVEIYDSAGFYFGLRTTDSAGHYAFDFLSPGTYFARTYNDQSYFDEVFDNLPCDGGCNVTTGTAITVQEGIVTTGINFALAAGGIITGRVREAASGLAMDAEITLYDADGSYRGYTGTDNVGRYRFQGLASGTYYLRASNYSYLSQLYDGIDCADGDCDPWDGDPVAATVGQTTAGIDFSLRAFGAVTGIVTDAGTGDPVPFLEIEATHPDGIGWAYDYTDSEGRYRIQGLGAGSYRVRTYIYGDFRNEYYDDIACTPSGCPYESATLVPVAPGSTAAGIDFALDRLARISGVVRAEESGTPLGSAYVVLWHQDGYYAGYGYTNEVGRYSLSGLDAGTYFATAEEAGYQRELFEDLPCPASCDPTTGTPVTASLGSESSGVDFSLTELGSISGRVIAEATGLPVAGCSVVAYNGDWYDGSGYTDAEGRYTIEGLEPGAHFVRTSCSSWLDELYDDLPCPYYAPCDPTTGDPIAVAFEVETTGIDFALRRLGSIRGRVTDTTSGTALSAYVSLWDVGGAFGGATYSDSLGNFELAGLRAGTYFAHAQSFEHLGELYNGVLCFYPHDSCDPTAGTPIQVSLDTAATGIDLALDRGPGIQGTVTAQGGGAPLAGVGIDVWLPSGQLFASTSTDAAGRYHLALDSGSYLVSTDAGLGGIDEVFEHVACPRGSAYAGLCDPLSGTLLEIVYGPMARADFALSVEGLFTDGFESGDLSAWSLAVP